MGYIFDPDVLHSIVRGVLDLPTHDKMDRISEELEAAYPGHIVPPEKQEWTFNYAGGAVGQMKIVHASLTEYILFFNSPIGTEGATGRFRADDFFYMLEGDHWSYYEGRTEKKVTPPGEVSILKRGEFGAYRLPEGGLAMEYARGAIPAMLPFGLADIFSSSLDFGTLAKTFRLYGRATMQNLARGKL
jgi:C-8 sterol isomerase